MTKKSDQAYYLNIMGAAARLGMSPTMIRNYIDNGELPVSEYVETGDGSLRPLIARADLEEFRVRIVARNAGRGSAYHQDIAAKYGNAQVFD